MKSIFETLSKQNIQKLSDYLDDNNFEKYFPKIRSLISSENNDENDSFWKRGSLNSIKYNRHINIAHKIIKIFYRADLIEELNKIIKDGGVLSSLSGSIVLVRSAGLVCVTITFFFN